MPKIKPFEGYLIEPAHAKQVVSPAYDAVSSEERLRFAEENPRNYLNTLRLLDDFPADKRPEIDQLLAHNKAKLDELIADRAFNKFEQPCMFLYRLSSEAHTQIGLVCEISIDEYDDGRLRKHENTRSDKEHLLAMYQEVVGVSSIPICIAYPDNESITQLIEEQTSLPPVLDFSAGDSVVQQIWCIDNAVVQARFQELFSRIDITYLTDGHHRAAAGWRHAQTMRKQMGNTENKPYNQLLVALFSTTQLSLLPFHRVVRDLNGLSEQALIEQLKHGFEVDTMGVTPFEPTRHGEFGMLVNGNWYRLQTRKELINTTDPVDSLDVSILQNHILMPLLGIVDARTDPRLDYVSGTIGVDGLTQKCAEGWAVCFACFATSFKQLMTVADAGALMPPKSTYFDPKMRAGIFISPK